MRFRILLLVPFIATCGVAVGQPLIRSLSPTGELIWSNSVPGLISVVERATNVTDGPWRPNYYDWGTGGWKTNQLSSPASQNSYYRVAVLTNAPDTNLVMHLSFDNDFLPGTVLDVSGHGNHGLRYGRPANPTNWPSATAGPDGSQAGEFHSYWDGYGLYGRSGDYIGIPITPTLTSFPKATIAVWARFYTSLNNDINNDQNSTLMNSGKDFAGTFFFGRNYANRTSFTIYTGPASAQEPILFPDVSPVGNSGGWHHYVITFEDGVVKGYFDGALIGTGTVPVAALTAAGRYIGIACWTFNVTPELDLTVDGHPNNAWINGAVDDVRMYRRVLDGTEIQTLYRSFDQLPPSVPGNLMAEVNSSSLTTLRWSASTDLFGVSAYEILRNGSVVGETTNTAFFDSGLLPATTYTYSLRARDLVGNRSAVAVATITTRAVDGGVDLVLDDADGTPWIGRTGAWSTTYTNSTVLTGVYRATFVSDDRINKGKSFTFTPPLSESGDYDVYVWHPGKADATHLFSTAVPVDIVSGSTTNTVAVNQRTGIGQWKLLGRYSLAPGAFVRVRTDGTSTSHYIQADAVRFVK